MSWVPKTVSNPKYDFLDLVDDVEETPGDDIRTVDRRGVSRTPANDPSHKMSTSSNRTFSSWTTPSGSATRIAAGSSSSAPRSSSTGIRSGSSSQLRSETGSSTRTPSGSARTLSSGTGTPRAARGSVIVAVVEGRGNARGEVGVASIDLKRPELVLSQFPDSSTHIKTITKLQILQPVEILMPNTACEFGKSSVLFQQLSEHFQSAGCSLVTVQRKYFNEARGLQCIKQLAIPECKALEIQLTSKYYCLATAAALLKYIEFIQNSVYAPNSLKVTFTGSENTTMIDYQTCKNLELILNQKDPKSAHTLNGVLHQTKTHGGARLLRANILQPPCDLRTVTSRLDAVTELLDDEKTYFALQGVIERFLDVDHLLSLCVQLPKQDTVKMAENKIGNVIYLKSTLGLVAPLRGALLDCKSELFSAYHEMLDDPRYNQILDKIDEYIQPGTNFQKGSFNMRLQKCYAIKANINGLLDIARRTYGEIIDDITEMTSQLEVKHKLSLQSGYSYTRGFYLKCILKSKNATVAENVLPAEFIKRCRSKNTVSFTTEDLDLSKMAVSASSDPGILRVEWTMVINIISKLLDEIIEHIGCLHRLSEIVSYLDLLLAFAKTCTMSPDHVRPEFSDRLCIKLGRHPILERIGAEAPVANDTYLALDTNFIIITGPNMSGKSTFLKQVALLQIMAQIGCYVPARYASFRLVDHIFSRMGSGDDIESNSSTFSLEMKEINYIISSVTDKSLVIIDELGRGTSVDEGIGICYAICEHLIETKAFTLFTTHFMELSYLDTAYPNVANYHLEVNHTVNDGDGTVAVSYTHLIGQGPTKEIDYGIQLAALTTLPESIVTNARIIATEVRAQFKASNPELLREARKRRATIQLSKILHQIAKHSKLSPDELKQVLMSLKQQYLEAVEVINRDEE